MSFDARLAAAARPSTRGECAGGPRPCPWVGCRHHLAVDRHLPVTGRHGPAQKRAALELAAEDDLDELPETCALDVADRGAHTLEELADLLLRTRQGVQAVEEQALERIRGTRRRRVVLEVFRDG